MRLYRPYLIPLFTLGFQLAAVNFTSLDLPPSDEFPGSPDGIDYQTSSQGLVFSMRGAGIHRIVSNGGIREFTPAAGTQEEIKIGSVRTALGGFTAGQVFFGSDQPGALARTTPILGNTLVTDVSDIPWVVLQSATATEQGRVSGISHDTAGIAGNDLIVVTWAGGVWRVKSSGVVVCVAKITGARLESCLAVPNNPALYGGLAGKILVGADNRDSSEGGVMSTGVWAVNPATVFNPSLPNSGVTKILNDPVEDLELVPSGQNFFFNDYNGKIWTAPSGEWGAYSGKILLTAEFDDAGHTTYSATANLPPVVSPSPHLRTLGIAAGPNGTWIYSVVPVPSNLAGITGEHSTFAPIAISGQPFLDPGTPPDTGPITYSVTALVQQISEEGNVSGVFRVFRTGNRSSQAMLGWALPAGTGRAELNVDYTVSHDPAGPITLDPGQDHVDVLVSGINDSRRENTETIRLELLTAGGVGTPANPAATINLVEADTVVWRGKNAWTLVDLGVLATGAKSRGFGINNLAGSLAQVSCSGTLSAVANAPYYAFRYQNGVRTLLPTANLLWSHGYALNNSGHVVGQLSLSGSVTLAGYVWENAGPILLLPSFGGETLARGISTGGTIAGTTYYFGQPDAPPGGVWRAVVWDPPSGGQRLVRQLGTLASPNFLSAASYANALNDSGQVVGKASTDAGVMVFHAFRTQPNAPAIDFSLDDLGTLAGSGYPTATSEAFHVNSLGEVVGASATANGTQHAFLSNPGLAVAQVGILPNGLRELATSGPTVPSLAVAINNRGIVLGYDNGEPVLWWNDGTRRSVSDLASLASGTGWVIQTVVNLNDENRIVGTGLKLGAQRAFMLLDEEK